MIFRATVKFLPYSLYPGWS